MTLAEVIVVDKDILGGMPVFKGTRVPVKNLFDYLKTGDSIDDFLNDFDYIPREYCIAILNTSEKLIAETKFSNEAIKKIKPSEFRGQLKLSEEQYQDFQNHLKDIRDEWERDI